MRRAVAFLKLTRFPLAFTAMADSAAGYLVAAEGRVDAVKLALLAAASACLYACGMVLNDVADSARDRELHPERPIPSGQVAAASARLFGMTLAGVGIACAAVAGTRTAVGALAVFALILIYNFVAKSWVVPGALTMGTVRAANFVLGSLAAGACAYAPATVLAGYVFFLTLMSTLEERRMSTGLFVLAGFAMSAAPAVGLAIVRPVSQSNQLWAGAVALLLSAALIGHSLASVRGLDRAKVMRNVRWGVLAIIAVDATFVLARVGWQAGLGVLALALPALLLLPLFRRL